jgi:hypothetical protein
MRYSLADQNSEQFVGLISCPAQSLGHPANPNDEPTPNPVNLQVTKVHQPADSGDSQLFSGAKLGLDLLNRWKLPFEFLRQFL